MCAPKVHQFKKEIPKVDKKYCNYVYAQNESMKKKEGLKCANEYDL